MKYREIMKQGDHETPLYLKSSLRYFDIYVSTMAHNLGVKFEMVCNFPNKILIMPTRSASLNSIISSSHVKTKCDVFATCSLGPSRKGGGAF